MQKPITADLQLFTSPGLHRILNTLLQSILRWQKQLQTTYFLFPASSWEQVAAILLLCKSAHVYCSALFTKFLQAQLKILFFIKPYLTRQANMLGSFTGLLNLEPFSILCLCPCLAFTPHVSVPCQWAYPATESDGKFPDDWSPFTLSAFALVISLSAFSSIRSPALPCISVARVP